MHRRLVNLRLTRWISEQHFSPLIWRVNSQEIRLIRNLIGKGVHDNSFRSSPFFLSVASLQANLVQGGVLKNGNIKSYSRTKTERMSQKASRHVVTHFEISLEKRLKRMESLARRSILMYSRTSVLTGDGWKSWFQKKLLVFKIHLLPPLSMDHHQHICNRCRRIIRWHHLLMSSTLHCVCVQKTQ